MRHWGLWKDVPLSKNSLSPNLPIYFILNCGSTVPLNSLGSYHRCSFKNTYTITEFQRRTKRHFGFSFQVNLLHLLFLPLICDFCRLLEYVFTLAYCIMQKLFPGVLRENINSTQRKKLRQTTLALQLYGGRELVMTLFFFFILFKGVKFKGFFASVLLQPLVHVPIMAQDSWAHLCRGMEGGLLWLWWLPWMIPFALYVQSFLLL